MSQRGDDVFDDAFGQGPRLLNRKFASFWPAMSLSNNFSALLMRFELYGSGAGGYKNFRFAADTPKVFASRQRPLQQEMVLEMEPSFQYHRGLWTT